VTWHVTSRDILKVETGHFRAAGGTTNLLTEDNGDRGEQLEPCWLILSSQVRPNFPNKRRSVAICGPGLLRFQNNGRKRDANSANFAGRRGRSSLERINSSSFHGQVVPNLTPADDAVAIAAGVGS